MIRILVVEDDPMVGKFHEHYIKQLKDFELIDTARTSEQALKFLEKQSYDLVLLDIFMPGIDGLQLLKEIRNKNFNVDVIVISAANEKEQIQTAMRFGAVDYIIKPFEFERFNLALNNYKLRRTNLENLTQVKQEDLDKNLTIKETPSDTNVPKGLDKNTLKLIWEIILKQENMFTTDEIASSAGISRVSIRKYLEFFKSLNVLSLELHRGSVGRPIYKYKCLDKSSSIINHYVE
ncbi:response regulator [Succinispira mobilis]|uniref:response regulator n=1 Tax=Succinispira mobilis TaxID=78120 RepID=UPI00036769F9|nr:response regulator [Succinispira mobilis]